MSENEKIEGLDASPGVPEWKAIVARYQRPSLGRAAWQVTNTVGPYLALWYVMYLTLGISWWLTVGLAVLAGGFLVRIFIIFHDCGHGCFVKSRKANDVLGAITGILTLTPYFLWRGEHAVHHSTSGDLNRRGTGDIWTMTVREYQESKRWRRLTYRLARNPVVLFVLAPLYLFLVKHRWPFGVSSKSHRRSVYWTNAGVIGIGVGLSWLMGFEAFAYIQLTIIMVAGSAGVWLFYVQHQFEGVYWARGEQWDFGLAALQGSSFYKLPRILQWFSGNIGYHHIHHLSSRIPNYHLERCHNAHPIFSNVKPVTLLGSLKSMTFRLWDEQCHCLVGYSRLRTVGRQRGE